MEASYSHTKWAGIWGKDHICRAGKRENDSEKRFSDKENSRVLVVEDVITTGGSVKEVMELVGPAAEK